MRSKHTRKQKKKCLCQWQFECFRNNIDLSSNYACEDISKKTEATATIQQQQQQKEFKISERASWNDVIKMSGHKHT